MQKTLLVTKFSKPVESGSRLGPESGPEVLIKVTASKGPFLALLTTSSNLCHFSRTIHTVETLAFSSELGQTRSFSAIAITAADRTLHQGHVSGDWTSEMIPPTMSIDSDVRLDSKPLHPLLKKRRYINSDFRLLSGENPRLGRGSRLVQPSR